jgi:hypothetical protein
VGQKDATWTCVDIYRSKRAVLFTVISHLLSGRLSTTYDGGDDLNIYFSVSHGGGAVQTEGFRNALLRNSGGTVGVLWMQE